MKIVELTRQVVSRPNRPTFAGTLRCIGERARVTYERNSNFRIVFSDEEIAFATKDDVKIIAGGRNER